MIIFKIPGKPQGKARARTFYNPKLGRSQSVTPENTVMYENLIKQCFGLAYEEQEERWMDREPLEMTIVAYFKIPKSTTKKDRTLIEKGLMFPTKKPDADNIAKVVCDALNGIAYRDDTQIVRLHIMKEYTTEEPYVWVAIDNYLEERYE